MKPKGVIQRVKENSIAADIGIEKGDKIIEINQQVPEDLIDISFLMADEYLELLIEKPEGEEWVLEIEKEYDEDVGVSFEDSTFDGINRCQNKCIFCFVDQMPPQLRETLYIKDDDYRMSFLHGNFVTFTNLTDANIDRILRLRLSPLYISVHTTNPLLRERMLNNRRAGQVLPLLKRITEADLEIHTQVVLCPDVNDGVELSKTIEDLVELGPHVKSIAIVPVGLTKFRKGLSSLKAFDKNGAEKVIQQVKDYQDTFLNRYGSPIVYLADEFYLLAEVSVPPKEAYGDFPQLENGVGLVRLFIDSFYENINKLPLKLKERRIVTIVTGHSASKVLKSVVSSLNKIENLETNLEVIVNSFFGETVTVAGLITGQDIYNQLKDKRLQGELFIPSVMLKAEEEVFIDGMTLKELEIKLKINIKVIDVNQGAEALISELGV